MSRCFPFPPPGYEKKAKIDDTDLLRKEKHKEKKHKKDKKDKEKREDKEKNDKDRSKEKHKEKKDRKDKHRDKDKRKDKDKEKKQISDEKRVEGQATSEKRVEGQTSSEKRFEGHSFSEKRVEGQNSSEKRIEGQPGFYIGEKFGSNNLQNNEIKHSRYVQELARRIRDEDRALGSQMVQKIAASDQRKPELQGVPVENSIGNQSNKRKAELQGMPVESSIGNQSYQRKAELQRVPLENGNQSEGKKEVKDKIEDHRKVNGQRNLIVARSLEKAFGDSLPSMGRESVGVTRLVEKKGPESQTEGKEKIKYNESDGKDDKHNGKNREKKRKSKDKDRDKEKKEEKVKTKEIGEPSKEQPKVKENDPKPKEHSKDSLDLQNIKQSDPLKLSSTSSAGEGNLGKRKELEINGYLLGNENRPSKFPRPLDSSHPIVENGRKLEQSTLAASEKQWPVNNHRVDSKEHKINGLVAPRGPNVCSTGPSSANKPANENGEASAKPPHPDTKYLSQMFSVPTVGELPDYDDQEWLFGSNMHSTKLNRDSPGIDGKRQVWSEALQIESADILALPYVVPY